MDNLAKQQTKNFFGFKVKFTALFNQWLSKRIPPSTKQQLSNRNVFIFPSQFGFVYLLFVLVLFLLATNYQNNLIMLLSYLLASLFISSMLHSFFNLSGITLETPNEVKGFAGGVIYLPIKLSSNKARFSLNFNLENQKSTSLDVINKNNLVNENTKVLVPFFANQRGIFKVKRVKVASEFALGLFTCWTRLDFACQFIVYPQPLSLKLPINYLHHDDNSPQGALINNHGDDFYQLKNYQQGEPLTQVAWKHLAKGQGWLSKSYQQNQAKQLSLNIAEMPASDLEKKLSYLCYLVQEFYQTGLFFSLELKKGDILSGEGKLHLQQCLLALAEFKQSKLE